MQHFENKRHISMCEVQGGGIVKNLFFATFEVKRCLYKKRGLDEEKLSVYM